MGQSLFELAALWRNPRWIEYQQRIAMHAAKVVAEELAKGEVDCATLRKWARSEGTFRANKELVVGLVHRELMRAVESRR